MARDVVRILHTLFLPAAGLSRTECWQPSADVYRTQDGWLVKFDLAGVPPKDIQVTGEGTHLVVRGTRRDWAVQEGWQHYSMEISYSQFERRIALPSDLEKARLTTEYRHGMLLVGVHEEER